MALFKRDFNKPGPGVPKNAPKKRGVARFFEIIGRDFSNLMKLNLLYLLSFLPAVLAFLVALFFWAFGMPGPFLIAGLVALAGSVLIGPSLTSIYNLLTRMMRDEPGFIWHNYKKTFRENFKTTVIPGLLYALLAGSQVIAVLFYFVSGGNLPLALVAVYLFALLLFNLAYPYYFLQASYLDLSPMGVLKNSLLFAMGYLPKTLAGFGLAFVLVAAQFVGIYLFPPLIILPLVFGLILAELVRLMWYWPVLDKTFDIDKTLRKRAAEQLDESLEEQGIEPTEIE